ncbi:N-carbamoyl-D-amino-acid hydrolase, partial [Tremellales sp. Uapishka_1]
MPRHLKVAAAQVGAVHRSTSRAEVLTRLIKLLQDASAQGVKLAVFRARPSETTFTTFFPRYYIPDEVELASYFEKGEPVTESDNVKSFFAKAVELGVDVQIGYGEDCTAGRFNTAVYVSGKSGKVLGKYRKVHLPGTFEPFDLLPDTTNQLEKRYFLPGNLGFPAFRATSLKDHCGGASPIIGQLICNDRRWAEGWRCYGLQGVEILCCGYNTTAYAPKLWGGDQNITKEKAYEEAMVSHLTAKSQFVVQAHAYTNSMFCITSGRAGVDDGIHPLIPGSMIVDPEGHIVAESKTQDDELVVATIDLDECLQGKERTFNLGKHRRPEMYGDLVREGGVNEPPEP